MAVLDEIEKELVPPKKSDMVGGVSRGAVGRRRRKKPESVLDEVNREVSDEPEPEDVLTQVRRETETDPETVRRMRAEGQRLSTEQQRIAFEAERARPLTDVALGAAGAFVQAVPQTVGQLARGTAKFAYEGVGKPVGEAVLAGLIYEPGSDEYEQALSRTFGGANNAVRSLASGVAQDIEETANAAVRAGMFGTSMTDIAAEKLGIISPEQSFNNYLAREEMRRTEAEDRMENPDRAATMLARNPLAGTVLQGASMLSGNGLLTPEEKQAGLAAYQEQLLQDAKFRPDEDISMLGEVVSPVGLPARLVRPVTDVLGGTMEAAGGLAVRGVTKPTIRGVNPLEGVGIGIRKIGESAEAAGAKVSEAITGRPDTFFATPGTVVSAFTRRPGQLIEGTGRTLRDIGRQIDEGGIRGRTGIIERLGRDPQTAPWLQDLFGPGSQKKLQKFEAMNKKRVEAGREPLTPGRGGVNRARTADYGLRLANSLSKSGVSGAALNGIIGAADIETAEEFGRATGVGFGIGSFMAARVPERVGAALDPRLDMRTRIDRVVETDPLDRRLDEEADRKRFQATADPELVRQVEKLASPEEQVAARMRELDDLFQQKAEKEYAEEDTTELDNLITIKADEVSALQKSTKDLDQKSRDERRRAVELIMADGLDLLKSNGRAAGLNGVNVQILDPSQIETFVRERWGQTLVNAEAIQAQLSGRADLSPSEQQSLLRANQTIDRFNKQKDLWPKQTGFALSESNQEGAPAHLRMANVGAPTIVMNSEQLMRDPRRVGLRYLMQHESNHILEQFREVQEMQRPVRDLFFGKRVTRPDGTVVEAAPGIITDEWINDVGIPMYAMRLYGPNGEGRFRSEFDTPQDVVEYVRSELMSELSAMSESSYSTIREALDSPGQAIIDRLLVSRKNSMLGRLRAALEFAGVQLDNRGDVKSVIFGDQAPFDPDVLAMMRQFKRELREFNDLLTYTGSTAEADVEISRTELMTNRALQEAYKDDVLWDKEVVLDVRDDEGNVVSQIVLPDDPSTNSAVNEFRIVNGQLVDENGNVLQLSPGIDISGLPDGSRATVDTRIARNPDGSPKILTNREIEARARQRDQMIKDAIDNAPDDGFEGRLRDTGNGSYRGIMSPSQLQAVLALPNSVIPPSLKKNIGAFNEVLQDRDGTRILMEYQPALRRGKYRALSPKIRDVVPIGYQFSKQGNFLATTISVSRMFDKMNLWAQKRPENLNLWGRDLGKFWEDVTRVLDNHNKGLAGQTGLDVDPDIAMQKKNRINDFFNLFTKDTEAMNPSRTKLPARRGQDSADRLIMSARMDRINQMQISNAQKLPVDYGKMLVNFFPENEAQSLRLDSFQDGPIENDIEGGGMMPQFLPGIRYTSLPDDPKKTMADFYMLNAMLTTPPTGWSMGKFGGQATMYAPSPDPTGRYAGTRGEKYQDALDEAKQTLIPTLHGKILKALHFAISAELRHALAKKQPADLAASEFWQEYARQYSIQGSEMPDLKKERAPRRFKQDHKGYVNSFIALENARKKLGMSVADMARFAEQMFRTGAWSSSYGGNPWGDIAQHLAQMSEPEYSTERVRAVVTDENGRMQMIETNEFRDPGAYSQMFQEIDRAYDLQHNTNTVFNKLKKYYRGSEGYGWIAKMLDFKANVGNPRELRGLVSGNMGKLADAWFADMRADAPLTQDLEERVKAQLPENFTIEAMEPQEFIDRLAKLAGTYYRKESSGVVREDPFSKIANDAERIHHNLKRGSEAWKEIKKDQNAHIGLILQDYFGDLGLAQTDAVKLFRMFLSEARDPRVVGARKGTQIPDVKINLPKPAPKPSGEWFTGSPASGFTFIPKQNVSSASNLVAFSEALIFKPEGINGLKLGDITVVNGGVTPEGVQKVHVYQGDSVSEENLKTTVDFTVAGKETVKDVADWLANYGFMQAKQSGYTSLMGWMAQDLTKSFKPTMSQGVKDILNKLETSTKPGNAAGTAAKNYLNYAIDLTDMEFVDANLGNLPPSGFDAAVKFTENILGPGSKELTSGEIFDLAEFLWQTGKWAAKKLEDRKAADLAKMEDQPTGDEDPIAPGYSDENGNPMTASQVAAGIKAYDPGANDNHVFFTLGDGTAVTNPYEDETGNPIENPPVGPTEEGLIMKYWADKGVLPAVSEAALVIFDKANPGHTYKPDTKLWDKEGLMGKVETLGMTLDNVVFDMGVPSDIEVSTKNGEITITKQPSGNTYQFQIDDQNWAIGPLDYVLKEAAEMLKKPSQAAENEKKAKAQAMEFLDNMLLDDPVKIGDNVWELESIEDDNGESVAAVVKLNGVAVSNQIPLTENMSIDAPPKAIYDSYFALDWMKDWKVPETKSLLSKEQEGMMQAASALVEGESEVTVGNKKFASQINAQGNMTIFGYNEKGNLTGAIPIYGSQTMDPIDLEAAVYEALDLLSAGTTSETTTQETAEITTQMINEAADALMNDETASIGKYTFEPIASGLGGTRVNIYIEPGMEDPVSYFMLDPGEYREPSDMLDAFYDKINEFLEKNKPEGPSGPGAKFMPAWSADQLAERPEITSVPDTLDEQPLRPRFVYRLESIEDDPKEHKLTDTEGFTFFTTSPESAAALALNFAYDGYRPTSENFSIYRYRLPENADIQRDHTLFNLDKMTSGQARVAAVKSAHEAMGLPLDAYRYVPADEVTGTTGKRIKFPENPDLMKIYRAIRRGGRVRGVQFMPGNAPGSSQVDQSLAGVAAPDTDQGPLSGARFMPSEGWTPENAQLRVEKQGGEYYVYGAWGPTPYQPKGARSKKEALEQWKANFNAKMMAVEGEQLLQESLDVPEYPLPEGVEIRRDENGFYGAYDDNGLLEPADARTPEEVFANLLVNRPEMFTIPEGYDDIVDYEDLKKGTRDEKREKAGDALTSIYEEYPLDAWKLAKEQPFQPEDAKRARQTLYAFDDGSTVVQQRVDAESRFLGKSRNKRVLQLLGPDGNAYVTFEVTPDIDAFIKDLDELVEIRSREEERIDNKEPGTYHRSYEKEIFEEYGSRALLKKLAKRPGLEGLITGIVGPQDDRGRVKRFRPVTDPSEFMKDRKIPPQYQAKMLEFLDRNPGKYIVATGGEEIGLKFRRDPKASQISPFYTTVTEKQMEEKSILAKKLAQPPRKVVIPESFKVTPRQIMRYFKVPEGEDIYDHQLDSSGISSINLTATWKEKPKYYKKSKTGPTELIVYQHFDYDSDIEYDFVQIASVQIPKEFQSQFNLRTTPDAKSKILQDLADELNRQIDEFRKKDPVFLEARPFNPETWGESKPFAKFMPGYNPRYTDDDGNFNFGLYSEDKRKTIAYLRDRMGITRKDFPNDEEWKRIIRETMRDAIRGD